MSELTPEKTLDARGMKCPMPVVKTSQEMKSISVGGILEVLATDPGSMADIQAWTKSSGNKLLWKISATARRVRPSGGRTFDEAPEIV